MTFLHPELLILSPLVALPIVIHLLNRMRYRRVRWAAIDFLLTSERRAIRRARLRQLLLMALRMLLLATALAALAQPVVRGGLAALLGGSTQVAVVLDASASMSTAGAGGSAFERAKHLARGELGELPRGTRAAAGTFAPAFRSPFREPLQDRAAVAAVLRDAPLTGGAADVPRALIAAAATLGRGGGGGAVWLLTDLQASGWRVQDTAAWDQVRRAFHDAGGPRLLITDLVPGVETNLSITAVRTDPAVVAEGDRPKLTATVELRSRSRAARVASVGLFLDGRRIDTRTHEFAAPGRADLVFRLPTLDSGVHAGRLELTSPDALPADDQFHFVLRAAAQLPVLVVDGAPSAVPFDAAADFVELALRPPESDISQRSRFTTSTIPTAELAAAELDDFVAVVLTDVPVLDPEAITRLRAYATGGGMVVVFPGAHTDVAAWNRAGFPDLPLGGTLESVTGKKMRLGAVAPNSPLTATLPAEGLDRVLVERLFRLDVAERPAETLIHTERGQPFLVRLQAGKGKVYVFAVSAQADFSNLPFTQLLLLILHRAIQAHLVDAAEPLARPAFSELRLSLPPGTHRMILPDGKPLPLARPTDGVLAFDQTGRTGIYRLASGQAPPEEAQPLAAFNVPPSESELEQVDAATVSALLPDVSVSVSQANSGADSLAGGRSSRSAASTFPLAALAIAFLLGEVLLAWSMTRPSKTATEGETP